MLSGKQTLANFYLKIGFTIHCQEYFIKGYSQIYRNEAKEIIKKGTTKARPRHKQGTDTRKSKKNYLDKIQFHET
jgi:hypothetical protein